MARICVRVFAALVVCILMIILLYLRELLLRDPTNSRLKSVIVNRVQLFNSGVATTASATTWRARADMETSVQQTLTKSCTNVSNRLLNGAIRDKLVSEKFNPVVKIVVTRKSRVVSTEAGRWWKVRQRGGHQQN